MGLCLPRDRRQPTEGAREFWLFHPQFKRLLIGATVVGIVGLLGACGSSPQTHASSKRKASIRSPVVGPVSDACNLLSTVLATGASAPRVADAFGEPAAVITVHGAELSSPPEPGVCGYSMGTVGTTGQGVGGSDVTIDAGLSVQYADDSQGIVATHPDPANPRSTDTYNAQGLYAKVASQVNARQLGIEYRSAAVHGDIVIMTSPTVAFEISFTQGQARVFDPATVDQGILNLARAAAQRLARTS
jgi:hypothetical protein